MCKIHAGVSEKTDMQKITCKYQTSTENIVVLHCSVESDVKQKSFTGEANGYISASDEFLLLSIPVLPVFCNAKLR